MARSLEIPQSVAIQVESSSELEQMSLQAHPATIEEYMQWASSTLGFDLRSTAARNRYDINVQNAQNAVQNSPFVRDFQTFLRKQEDECLRNTGAGLLMGTDITVVRKPFDSAVTKSYRLNVLRNRNFPNEPQGGWTGPDNWYKKFDDLVRSTLVCKFLDGPTLLAPAIDAYARSHGLTGRHVARSTEDGYYAFHQYTAFSIEIVDDEWQSHTTGLEFELQLTTQLQEVLRNLTHSLYEASRVTARRRDEHWKWEHDSPRFRASYLGHTLHLIEAVIVQVRDSIGVRTGGTLPTANSTSSGMTDLTDNENGA